MSSTESFSAQSLERMSDEEFWRVARSEAHRTPAHSSEGRARADQYLECALPQGTCLLPLTTIEEIIPSPSKPTLLPAMPRWMPGITSWRGEILAVVDLKAYLDEDNSEEHAPASNGLLLLARHPDLLIGLRVCSLGHTLTVEGESILPLDTAKGSSRALAGVAGELPVLDIDALLADVVKRIEEGKGHD
jgi:chemotaxis signal transduction protein